MEMAPVELNPRTRDFYVRTLTALNEAADRRSSWAARLCWRSTRGSNVTRKTWTSLSSGATVTGFFRRSPPPVIAPRSRFPHWLAKAYGGDGLVDIIYSSGNGVASNT